MKFKKTRKTTRLKEKKNKKENKDKIRFESNERKIS